MKQTIARISAVIAASILLAACSGNLRQVTDQPPQASLDGLVKVEDGIIVELALRNVNDRPLKLESAAITLTLDGQALGTGERTQPLSISARGREILRFSLTAQSTGLQRLDTLAQGRVERLPWSLEARLTLAGMRDRNSKIDGWLHRVPGQPDRFR